MPYVDAFVLPVPKKKLAAYRKMAAAGGKIWREHGALEFRECSGDELNVGFGMPFTKLTGAKASETVMFSWIMYKSKADRDRINKKAMADPRMAKTMKGPMPFDMKRMAVGGFNVMVDA